MGKYFEKEYLHIRSPPPRVPSSTLLLHAPSPSKWAPPAPCCVCACAQSPSRVLCDPKDCSPPGSSVHGISQTQVLEWVAISFSIMSMKYCFFICKMDTTRYLPHTIGCWKDQASHLALILSNVSSQSRLGGQV